MSGDFSSFQYLLISFIDKNFPLHLIKLFYSDVDLLHPIFVTEGREKEDCVKRGKVSS